MKVLAVDDSPVFRALLERSLGALGYTVSVAESGSEALKECSQELPDVVISDWSMPEMSGSELCTQLRQISNSNRHPYFILATALDDKAEILSALRSGVNDYLGKPFDQADLELKLQVAENALAS